MDNEELAAMLISVAQELMLSDDEVNHGLQFETDVCKMYNSVVDKDVPYKQ